MSWDHRAQLISQSSACSARAQRGKPRTTGARLEKGRKSAMHAFRTFYAALHARTAREEGQALVEYALILGLVSLVAIARLSAVGTDITSLLARVTDALASAL